jgi:hypothetical protein
MEFLSHLDWPTLLVGVLLGIPITYGIGIVAILHAPRFTQFLDRRKLLKRTKTKKQALVVFNRIKSFHDGTSDRYPYYIILASCAIICSMLALTLWLTLALQIRSLPSTSFGDVIVGLLGLIAFLMATLLLIGIFETARQIDRFDSYKVEFETRWGSVDSSE